MILCPALPASKSIVSGTTKSSMTYYLFLDMLRLNENATVEGPTPRPSIIS
jgi:hypothetical protein